MAKRNRSSKRPIPEHKKQAKSQHDKWKRLQHCNPDRKKTTSAKVPLVGAMQTMVLVLQSVMDRRIAFRLGVIIAGMLLANDRRTASAWFVAGGVQHDWDRFYDCLRSVGRISASMATAVLGLVVQKLAPMLGERILLGMDDSPTSRYGRHVEGAGVHHNPTPGPADGEWLYGHNWVCLAWLASHPLWGVIALPLWSLMYIRQVDVPKLKAKYGSWDFRTKHQLGVFLLNWFMQAIRKYGVQAKVWLVVDGAYTARPFLLAVLALDIVVVSRLRRDARLHDLPAEGSHANRIYDISSFRDDTDFSLDAVLQAVVDFIPPAIQFPEITCARLIFGSHEVTTKNFKDTRWKISREITVSNKWLGTLEVCYLEENPELDEGPFLKEAKNLINTVAENIAKIIEREEAEADIRKHQDHIETLIKKNSNKNIFGKTITSE